MRYSRFEFEKKSPVFRPPKYTGITLSLLSIFVLVSMLAVWEKMAGTPDLPVLNILAWDKAKVPLERIRVAYQKEASCLVNISYFSISASSSKINFHNPETKQKWDILLIPHLDTADSYITENNFDMQGPVASLLEKEINAESSAQLGESNSLKYWLNESTKREQEALSFFRFLKAPTKGQVEFGMDGWIGFSDDHWDKSPQFTIYAIKDIESTLNSFVPNFAKDRGLDFRISFLDEQSLLSSLKILTKADNKDYLPDLIFLPLPTKSFSWLLPFYSQADKYSAIEGKEYSLLLRKKTPLLKTCQKLLKALSDYE